MHPERGIKVEGILKKVHVKILKENLKQSAAKLDTGHCFVFQHNNNPKHTLLLVKNYLQKTKVNIIIENLWGELKIKVHARRPSNLEKLERFAKEEWAGIPQESCHRLVENYNKRLQTVTQPKEYTIYY